MVLETKKISQLPLSEHLSDDAVIIVQMAGETKRVPVSVLLQALADKLR